jgi:hypothetical protein
MKALEKVGQKRPAETNVNPDRNLCYETPGILLARTEFSDELLMGLQALDTVLHLARRHVLLELRKQARINRMAGRGAGGRLAGRGAGGRLAGRRIAHSHGLPF